MAKKNKQRKNHPNAKTVFYQNNIFIIWIYFLFVKVAQGLVKIKWTYQNKQQPREDAIAHNRVDGKNQQSQKHKNQNVENKHQVFQGSCTFLE